MPRWQTDNRWPVSWVRSNVKLPRLPRHPEWSGLADMITAAVADGRIPADYDADDVAGLLESHAEQPRIVADSAYGASG